MSNQNHKPLHEGTEKKGGINTPPKNPKPKFQPSGQKLGVDYYELPCYNPEIEEASESLSELVVERINKETEWINFKNKAIENGVPDHIAMALADYVIYKHPPGSFLRAILNNDLMSAFSSADIKNTRGIRNLIMFLRNDVPSSCWGDRTKVNNYILDRD